MEDATTQIAENQEPLETPNETPSTEPSSTENSYNDLPEWVKQRI